MDAAELQTEVEKLRAEVEAYRQRELAELRAALIAEREAAQHYRNEAQRNAEVGRQIASDYQAQVTELRTRLEVLNSADLQRMRHGSNSRPN